MRIAAADPSVAKGWYLGPWNSRLTLSLGYANEGVDEPHLHRRVTEIYLVARGTARMQVGAHVVELAQGDAIVVEPGELHTFLASSPRYFHFVLQVSGLAGEEARADKTLVPHPAPTKRTESVRDSQAAGQDA